MKIGIITFHRACNYGAYLQACALCARLNAEGFEAEIIDYYTRREMDKYISFASWSIKRKIARYSQYLFEKRKYEAFQRALNDPIMKKSEQTLYSDDLVEFQRFVKNKYNVIISGSDEVFKVNGLRGFPSAYWLPGDLGCTKMSYAASGRTGLSILSDEELLKLKDLLKEFSCISLRDDQSLNVFSSLNLTQTIRKDCDPSFLYKFRVPTVDIFDFFSNKIRIDRKKKSIIIMIHNISGKIEKWLKNELGTEYNLISVTEYHKGMLNFADLTPFEWLILIKNCDFVISSYFHGVCFSISQNTPFIAIEVLEKDSKISLLLRNTELSERLIQYGDYSKRNLKSMMETLSKEHNFDSFYLRQSVDFTSYLELLKQQMK